MTREQAYWWTNDGLSRQPRGKWFILLTRVHIDDDTGQHTVLSVTHHERLGATEVRRDAQT